MATTTQREQGDERELLLARLRTAGVPEREIDRARAEGRLPTLAVDLALGGAARHTLTAVAHQAGIDRVFLRRLLQAAGRPLPAPRERVFTDEDVELARLVKRLLDGGLPKDGVLEIARVVGHGMQQSAEAVRRVVGDALLRPGDSDEAVALRYVAAADTFEPLAGPLLAAVFKAHLRDGVRNALITEAERETGRLAGTADVAVAFADMVNYTKLGERLAAEDLGRVAGRFNEVALGAVRRPTQLVKTIGDAAMFVSPDVPALLRTVCALLDAVDAEGDEFPDVRVGIAYGPATARGGDWFGSPVNVASPGDRRRAAGTDRCHRRRPVISPASRSHGARCCANASCAASTVAYDSSRSSAISRATDATLVGGHVCFCAARGRPDRQASPTRAEGAVAAAPYRGRR